MAPKMRIGLDIISSYKRLSYTLWHAMAEFVDNSTQSYFNNKAVLDGAFAQSKDRLTVSIVCDTDEKGTFLRITDNAMGMSDTELDSAMHIGKRPTIATGRSQYGLGMKTAAGWLGDWWSVRTKRLGETIEYKLTVDVDAVVAGKEDLDYKEVPGKRAELHYTIIEIRKLNRAFPNRTVGKIKRFLSSMYRQDFRDGTLRLEWMYAPLKWDELDGEFLTAADGSEYKRGFTFDVSGKKIHGWVGILEKGGRSKAGFSMLHRNRVIKGWPDSWRPQTIFGQYQGSNDLVNQRIVGEVHLDDFLVSHTKDEILWRLDEEHDVEDKLADYCREFVTIAKKRRKGSDGRGPSEAEVKAAVQSLIEELNSPEMVDEITLEPLDVTVTPVVKRAMVEAVEGRTPSFSANWGSTLEVVGYIEPLSPNDPYVTNDIGRGNKLLVIVNMNHPHWSQIKGADGTLNYLRHCTYDGIAEWRVGQSSKQINPDTVKLIKDRLLRVALEMEMNEVPDEE